MRRKVFSIVCGISLFFASAAMANTKSLVRVSNLKPSQISQLAAEGYDIPSVGRGYAEMVLEGPQISAFVKKGHTVKVLVRDLDEYVKNVKKTQTKTMPIIPMTPWLKGSTNGKKNLPVSAASNRSAKAMKAAISGLSKSATTPK